MFGQKYPMRPCIHIYIYTYIQVGVVYRPSHASITSLDSLDEVMGDISTVVDKLGLVGDLNIIFLKNDRKLIYLTRNIAYFHY